MWLNRSNSKTVSNERGVTLVLLALILVVILALIALAIDTTIHTASHSEYRRAGEMAVMAGLERFGEQLGNNPLAPRVDSIVAGRDRARELLAANFGRNIGRMFFKNENSPNQDQISLPWAAVPNSNGMLTPVTYYFPIPVGPGCSDSDMTLPRSDSRHRACVCAESCWDDVTSVADANDLNIPINGFRLEYRTEAGGGIKPFFGSVQYLGGGGRGPSPTPFSTVATSVIVPRNAIFAVDLSPSVTANTHSLGTDVLPNSTWPQTNFSSSPTFCPLGNPIGSGTGIPFSYPMDPYNVCNRTTGQGIRGGFTAGSVSASCLAGRSDPQSIFECRRRPFPVDFGNWIGCIKQAWPANAAGASNRTGEYACIGTTGSNPVIFEDGTSRAEGFLTHVTRAPEPLTSIVNTVNQAMRTFENRRVPSDRIGIVGFDEDLIRNRILAENVGNPALRRPVLISDSGNSSSRYVEFRDKATNTVLPLTDPNRWQYYFFPRYQNRDSSRWGLNTDIPLALRTSRLMIQRVPNYRSAQNFVVLFTDGLTNCAAAPLGSDIYRCNGTDPYLSASMALVATEMQTYVNERITLHTLIFGANSAHDIAWKGSNGCATYDENLSDSRPIVDVRSTGAYGTSNYFRGNELLKFTAQSKGLWAPIRPCFKNGSTCVNFKNDMDNACRAAGFNNSTLNNNSGATDGQYFSQGSNPWPQGGSNLIPGSSTNFWDQNGRVKYDPRGETEQQQAQRYMDLILSKPPFLLVDK